MPRKLVAVAPRKAALVDYEEPAVGRNQVKVRVEYASRSTARRLASSVGRTHSSPTSSTRTGGCSWSVNQGVREAENGEGPALGNQWVGVIVEKGADVGRFRVGDRVCGYGSIREIQVLDAVDDPSS